jgi:hypothetical protein
MAVTIDQVDVETVQPPPEAPTEPAAQERRKLDVNELTGALRREHERLARLWVD